MPYNNLIYLLLVIMILATGSTPDAPRLDPGPGLIIFLAKTGLFFAYAHYLLRLPGPRRAAAYFAAEQRLTILAIIFFATDIYLLEAKFYFSLLPGTTALPGLVPYAGVGLFFSYLLIVWNRALPAYNLVFAAHHRAPSFLATNGKINLAILLPWLLITLLFDLLALIPFSPVKQLLHSPWGEPALMLGFFFLLLLIFPRLATALWGCRSLPAGPLRSRLEEFSRHHRVAFRDIMLWPLFEGRLLTAGVMGLSRHFRYLLITPALLDALNQEELEAVVAHEIGHVRHHHLLLYLFFFIGFAIFAHLASLPALVLLLESGLLEQLVELSGKSPLSIISLTGTGALLVLLVLYFRFLFGFFMRNFERQADLYALAAGGRAEPLIQVFEKIAWLGGKIRDLPSWHHFSIAQRIEFLAAGADNPKRIRGHHRKVRLALLAFVLALSAAAATLWQWPGETTGENIEARLVATILQDKIRREPANPDWPRYLGDLHYLAGRSREAVAAYEQSLQLAPEQPETLNNLAWLLLTAPDQTVHDPPRALQLALAAARLHPTAHILDTLATAWWRRGEREKAEAAAEAALAAATGDEERQYYLQQREKFREGR